MKTVSHLYSFMRSWNNYGFDLLPFLPPCVLPGSPTGRLGDLDAGDFCRHSRSSSSSVMRSDQVFVEQTGSSLRAFPPLTCSGFPFPPLTHLLLWYWRLFWALLSLLEPTASTSVLDFSSSPALGFSALSWLVWVSLCWGLTLPTRLACLPPPARVALLGNRDTAKE